MVGDKTGLSNFKKIEIIPSIVSGCNGLKLKITGEKLENT